jgi:hypothetical protein
MLENPAHRERAKILQKFFKTGPDEYGEGDSSLETRVSDIGKIAELYQWLKLKYIKCLLSSSFHEERLLALLIPIHQYTNGDAQARWRMYGFHKETAATGRSTPRPPSP